MFQRVADALRRAFGWEYVACASVDWERGRFVCEALSTDMPSDIHVGYSRALGSGVVGEVALTGRPILRGRRGATAPNYVDTLPGAAVRAVRAGAARRGARWPSSTWRARGRAPFTDQLPLLETVAEQVAGAIANARLYDEVRRRARLLEMVSEVSKAALDAGELHLLLQRIVDYVHAHFPLSTAAILLVDEARRVRADGPRGRRAAAGAAGHQVDARAGHRGPRHPHGRAAAGARRARRPGLPGRGRQRGVGVRGPHPPGRAHPGRAEPGEHRPGRVQRRERDGVQHLRRPAGGRHPHGRHQPRAGRRQRAAHAGQPPPVAPLLARRADGDRQPPPLRPAAGAGVAARGAHGAAAVAAAGRHRLLQGLQRPARPPAGRRVPARRWRRGWRRACTARATWWRATAARSSPSCLPTPTSAHAATTAEMLRARVEAMAIPHGASGVSPVVTLSLGIATVRPRAGLHPQALVEARRPRAVPGQARGPQPRADGGGG